MLLIREHCREAFNKIEVQHGIEHRKDPIIPPDISLKQVIGYTRSHIIENETEHFRYDRYWKALEVALKQSNFRSGRKNVHLDLGCGPGLFSWVMRDYILFRQAPLLKLLLKYNTKDRSGTAIDKVMNATDTVMIGYDYAEKMIELAGLFQSRLRKQLLVEDYNLEGYSKVGDIKERLNSEDFSNCDVIVTFGYVLVQTKDNLEAMNNFADIIACLFPFNSCILIAVDAYRRQRDRKSFLNACVRLREVLNKRGVNLDGKPITHFRGEDRGSRMYARLTPE